MEYYSRILGLSCAIFLRCKRLQTCRRGEKNSLELGWSDEAIENVTMNAFIGRFMWSSCGFFINDDDVSRLKIVELLEKNCFKTKSRKILSAKANSPVGSDIVEQTIELLMVVEIRLVELRLLLLHLLLLWMMVMMVLADVIRWRDQRVIQVLVQLVVTVIWLLMKVERIQRLLVERGGRCVRRVGQTLWLKLRQRMMW